MPTSELSDALNPHVAQARPRSSTAEYAAPFQPALPPPQQYIPHRSELELAISEPPPPPPPRAALVRARGQPSAEGVHAVQELLRIVSATREAQEIERKRRLAWEQEQEAKYAQRQAEMERRMFEMRQEITSLRSAISINPPAASGLITPHYSASPALSERRPQLASPISPVSQPSSSYPNPTFVQGSSNQPLTVPPSYFYDTPNNILHLQQPGITVVEPPPNSVTPSPSPQLTFIEPSQLQPEASTVSVNRRKRHSSDLSSDDGSSSGSDSSTSRTGRPLKRTSHHDKRCLTIHHAMRAHILRVMELVNDKELPDSHTEGAALAASEPVRFVWDKTSKQSVHNTRMKSRVLADLKAKRRSYKHVPDKDFNKKILDSAFDQCFTTLRQKFKAQRDALTALNYRQREDQKAQRARHLSRRKIKLSNRAEARMKIDAFEHVTFDGALQVECMSSEESDFDNGATSPPRPPGLLRTRGYLWRSTRLVRFYGTLDDEEKADKNTRPKRGLGKKERCTGPPKEAFHLPPQGIATWMISRRWINNAQTTHPDLQETLKKLVIDPPGFDWAQFNALGEESEDSDDEQTMQGMELQHPHMVQQHYTTPFPLSYAQV